MSANNKGNPWALIPFVVFLILFIGSGIITKDFYSFPVIVAISIASAAALAMNRKETFNQKVEIFCKGAGDSNIMLMVIIFLWLALFPRLQMAWGS